MTDEKQNEVIIDMPESQSSDMNMINDSYQQAEQAINAFKEESRIAQHIKEFFDKKYGPNWHCVVGKHFNSYCSYNNKNFIFFKSGQLAVLLYRKG